MSVFYTSVDRIKNDICVRGYKDGEQFKRKVRYKPSFFINTPKKSELRSLHGENVDGITFDSLYEANQFVREHSDVGNFHIHGQNDFILQFIGDVFGNDIKFDRDIVNVTTIDIEVQSDKGFPKPEEALFPVTAITVKNNIDNVFYTWGLGEWSLKKSEIVERYPDLKIKYIQCEDESDLLSKFLIHWINNYPDVITGWNSRIFDTVYLVNRIAYMLDPKAAKKLSPWGDVQARTITAYDLPVFELAGIQQLDYLDLFRKFGYSYGTQASYKLDSIAHVVLGERKLDYSEYGSLNNLYTENHQKFIDYNIRDVQVVDRLEDKMGLITLAMTVAYKTGVNLTDTFGSVKVWDAYIANELANEGIVIPPKKVSSKEGQIEGAYVKDPQTGLHSWVVSFDLNSLYPHIMMQYNMSPETISDREVPDVTVLGLLNKEQYSIPDGLAMTARGNLFRKDKHGIIPRIIQRLYDERKVIKGQMLKREQDLVDIGGKNAPEKKRYPIERDINILNNQQMAVKILMNSLYGALSNKYFRYFDTRVAESVTKSGQLTIRWAEKTINNYMNNVLKTNDKDYVIAIDTDSLYVNMDSLVNSVFKGGEDTQKIVQFLDKVASEKLTPTLNKAYQDLYEYMHAYDQKMVMDREVIADRGVWVGKKRYALNVWNSEGVQYEKAKLKIMGIESVRSSTPQPCRNMIEESLKIILNENEKAIQEYIAEKREWFRTLDAEDVAFPRGISDLDKYQEGDSYKKATPIHVRGTILYNNLLKKHRISTKYETVHSGEKIKFVYLKQPNPIGENVIAFPQVLPDEFDLRQYIDYDLQFDKAYYEPINNILKRAGWHGKKINTLEDFFS